jgi:hypothetical protein
MKAKSEPKPGKSSKDALSSRQGVSLTASEDKFITLLARKNQVTKSEAMRQILAAGRRATQLEAEAKRLGGLRADVKVLEAQLNDIAAQASLKHGFLMHVA